MATGHKELLYEEWEGKPNRIFFLFAEKFCINIQWNASVGYEKKKQKSLWIFGLRESLNYWKEQTIDID